MKQEGYHTVISLPTSSMLIEIFEKTGMKRQDTILHDHLVTL